MASDLAVRAVVLRGKSPSAVKSSMVGPSPCEFFACENAALCATAHLACRSFAVYCEDNILLKPSIPSKRRYIKIYGHE